MSVKSAIAFLTKAHEWAKEVETTFGIPARYALAQAAMESRYGLSASGNRYFGIKATGNPNTYWKGTNSGMLSTKEGSSQGTLQTTKQSFRTYNSGRDSFMDWGLLISTSKYYKDVYANRKNGDAAWIKAMDASPYSTLKDGSYGKVLKQFLGTIDGALKTKGVVGSPAGKIVSAVFVGGLVAFF